VGGGGGGGGGGVWVVWCVWLMREGGGGVEVWGRGFSPASRLFLNPTSHSLLSASRPSPSSLLSVTSVQAVPITVSQGDDEEANL